MGGVGSDESARTLGPGGRNSVQDRASTVVRTVVRVALRILEALQAEQEAHGEVSFAQVGVCLDRTFVVSATVRELKVTAELVCSVGGKFLNKGFLCLTGL